MCLAFITTKYTLFSSAFYFIMSTTTGTYIYMESSAPRHPGDRAHLVSQTFTPTQSRCVTFWYHMNGANIGTLNVVVKVPSSNYTAWTLSGDHGDKWIYAQAPVTSNLDYQVSPVFILFLHSPVTSNLDERVSGFYPVCIFTTTPVLLWHGEEVCRTLPAGLSELSVAEGGLMDRGSETAEQSAKHILQDC